MKTITRYLSGRKVSIKSILITKFKSIANRYKRCRFWLTQSLKRISSLKKTSVNGRNKINDIFCGLDDDRDLLVRRLNDGQNLYPNCDTSVWLRNCTQEILNPIQGKIEGK